jgi:beta-glucosidase
MYKRFDRTKLDFTPEEWAVVKGSNEFFGLNHYSTFYATGEVRPLEGANARELALGPQVRATEKDGVPIGRRGQRGHPYDVAWGFRLLLQYIDKRYLKPSGHRLYVTENGYAIDGETELSTEEAVQDKARQSYYAGYIREAVLARTEDGIDIAGYMAWSLME